MANKIQHKQATGPTSSLICWRLVKKILTKYCPDRVCEKLLNFALKQDFYVMDADFKSLVRC